MVPIDDSSILISTSVRSIQELPLPPGFRFHPTDDELMWYLRKQASSEPFTFRVIATVNLYDFDPWELPGKALFGEKEWYFFTPRYRKYPKGNRPNRRAKSGYWKATGADKLIYMPNSNNRGPTKAGVKRSLVFYQGKAPKGDKTDWIMHEYILTEDITQPSPPLLRCGSPPLNESVLCRIRQKIPSQAQRAAGQEQERESMLTSAMANLDEQRATDFPAEDNLYSVAVTSETNTFPLTMPNISCATTFAAPEFQDTRAMPNIWNPHHAIASSSHVMPERSGPALLYNMHHPELQCYPPLSSSSFTDPSHSGGTYFMSPASHLPCFSDEVESQVQYYGGNANALPFTSVDHFLPTDQSIDPTPGEMHSFSYGHAPGPNHFS